jgi:hypothetical protein
MAADQPALSSTRPLMRSVAYASVALPVSLAGHLAAGGCTPDEASVLLAFVLLVLVHRRLVATRERSWAALTGWLVVGQLAVHTMLNCSPTPRQSSGDVMTPAEQFHMHAGTVSPAASTIMMVAGHGAAAVALGWFLRQGERVLWSAARRASCQLSPLFRRVRVALATVLGRQLLEGNSQAVRAPVSTTGADARVVARQCLHATSGRRRGPPVGVAAGSVG